MLNPTLQYSTANGASISDETLMEAITEQRPRRSMNSIQDTAAD